MDQYFISFANAPLCWRLVDGSRPPAKKYFDNESYDKDTRRFRGTINWGDTPFKSKLTVRWVYDFVFTENFNKIESGTIYEYDKENELEETGYFKLSYFGEPTPEGGHILLYKIDKKMEVKAALEKLTDQCNICFSCGDKRKNTITPECGHKMCKECIIGK